MTEFHGLFDEHQIEAREHRLDARYVYDISDSRGYKAILDLIEEKISECRTSRAAGIDGAVATFASATARDTLEDILEEIKSLAQEGRGLRIQETKEQDNASNERHSGSKDTRPRVWEFEQ